MIHAAVFPRGTYILGSILLIGMLPLLTGPGCPGLGQPTDDPQEQVESNPPPPEQYPAAAPAIATDGFGCDAEGVSSLYAGRTVSWGDLHAHTRDSQDAVNYNACDVSPYESLVYAADVANLDFVALTDHAEDGSPGEYTQAKWNQMIADIQRFEDERAVIVAFPVTAQIRPPHEALWPMVVFPAFEYTKTWANFQTYNAGTPNADVSVHTANGHKNIICYDRSTLPPRGVGYDKLQEDICDTGDCTLPGSQVVLAAGTKLSSPTALWAYLDDTPAQGKYLCIPHHPAKASDRFDPQVDVRTDWKVDYMDGTVQPLVEIYSRHGSSEMAGADDDAEHVNEFDNDNSVATALGMWFATSPRNDAYKLGFVGGTDTHDGDPGAVEETSAPKLHPDGSPVLDSNGNTIPDNTDERLGTAQNGLYTGGLTAVWVPASRDRDEIWAALSGRNCYGTSGTRIRVEFTAKLGEQLAPMGSTLQHDQPLSSQNPAQVNLHVRAVAESGLTITRVQIFKADPSGAWCYDFNYEDPASPITPAATIHVDQQDTLTAEDAYYRVKVWQKKASNPLSGYGNINHERAWSSPIWVERVSTP